MTTTEKIFNHIRRQTEKAIGDFNLIEKGDRIAVGISGGKDQKRQQMKQLINNFAEEIPEIRNSMISAIGNVHPRHLLDRRITKTG